MHPNWPGVVFERMFRLDGDSLTLRTPPVTLGGTAFASELFWHRVG